MSRDESFADRYGPRALVVGASEGIGAAIAEGLAERGLDLLLVARKAERLATFASSIEERYGRSCRAMPADMAKEADAEAVAEAAVREEIGLLVYNAAFAPPGPFLERSVRDHLQAIAVNSRGVVLLSHRVGQHLVSRGHGGIIIMCSLAGLQGAPRLSIYGATKAFGISLAEALHVELAPRGVDVLGCIAGATSTPGYRRTMGPPGPNGRYPFYVMTPEAVARTALRGLGRSPLVVAGAVNRTAAFLMRRLLSRGMAVRMMGGASAPADPSASAGASGETN